MDCNKCTDCTLCENCYQCDMQNFYSLTYASNSIKFTFADIFTINPNITREEMTKSLDINILGEERQQDIANADRLVIQSEFFSIFASDCPQNLPNHFLHVSLENNELIFSIKNVGLNSSYN